MLSRLLIFALIVMTTSTFAQTPTIDAGVSQTLAKWRGANYSDVRYKLNLKLEKMAPTLKGSTEVSVNLKTASDVVLDWRKIKGKEQFYKIANVELNGAKVEAKEINEHLVINGGKQGANTIRLDFESPIATSGAAITRYVDKEDGAEYVYSLFVPSDASTAFPVFDQPDLKARFTLTVHTKIHWQIVSNEEIEGEQVLINEGDFLTKGTKAPPPEFTYFFKETKPISTYVFAFAAGEFEEFIEGNNEPTSKLQKGYWTETQAKDFFNREKHRIYVRKSQAEKFKQHAAETFRLNREAVKYLESYFDYKFPFPKYDLVLIPEFPFGGMEHAGATFLRESSVIFPSEPTANDYISRANLIFHEAAHQWFGDTVTMKWFDDLWLKEGFAEFMAYKTLEKVLPEYNAWKAFYERNKPLAYLTDSTRGTTPIYQEIPNLSAAKSAYGNIVYRKAPSFLRQAEFYLGEDKFQIAVRAFLKKHQFANAEWTDLVKEFETASGENLTDFANYWVKKSGTSIVLGIDTCKKNKNKDQSVSCANTTRGSIAAGDTFDKNMIVSIIGTPMKKSDFLQMKMNMLFHFPNGATRVVKVKLGDDIYESDSKLLEDFIIDKSTGKQPDLIFPNYQDYGYGIFLLDERSRDYVLKNIQNERDDFLRSMMWGTLWDSVREAELAPGDYVTLAIKNISTEKDELTIQTILGRVSTAMNYYLSDAQSKELAAQLETLLTEKMQNAQTLGQRITFYRAFLNIASTENARATLKQMLNATNEGRNPSVSAGAKNSMSSNVGEKTALLLTRGLLPLRTKDRFDIVTKLLVLGDKDAANLLAELEKTETSDEAKRYAYAAKAGIATAENKQKFFSDFVGNKEISESYIETAFAPFNSSKHAELTLPFLENALKELPNLRRSRKIFFVNGWLAAFIGGQKSEQALQIVNKFLTDNPNLDKDLRLKVLEVADGLERAVKIRKKFSDTK